MTIAKATYLASWVEAIADGKLSLLVMELAFDNGDAQLVDKGYYFGSTMEPAPKEQKVVAN